MNTKKWIRPKNAPIAGVCGAIANALDVNPTLVRILWLIAGLFYGTGFCLYLICWFFLPKEEKQFEPDRPVFLGVCYRLSKKTNIELAVIRIALFISFFATATLTFWGYFIAHLLIPKVEDHPGKI